MSKQKKTALAPKLRFPEFKDDWKIVPLNNIADKVTNRNRSSNIERVLTNSAIDGVVDQRDYFDKDIANKGNLENYFIVEKGDYVYNPRISNAAPVGPISKNRVGKGVMSPLYTVFRFKINNNDFYAQYFKTSKWHTYLKNVSNTGARHDRMSLSVNDFMSMPLPNPEEKEKHKIEECLTSIDDLITAQSQKLEALKAHKKGLTQNLFPDEGETVPKLRFPEFGGDWSECMLSSKLANKPEYGINAAAVPYDENLPIYLRITDISEDGRYLSEKKVSVSKEVTDENYLIEGDIVLARTGASVGKSYKYRKADGQLVFAGFLIRIRPDMKNLDSEFIYQYLSTDRYWRWVALTSARSGQPGINGSEYSSLPVPIPPERKEQQKIANCLTSIDDLINAQVQKLEALKAHKKGLMQNIFPAIDEVDE